MKLSQKLFLSFMCIVGLLVIAGIIQVVTIAEIEQEVREISESNVGEARGSIDLAYRIALIGGNLNEYLLESSIGHTDHRNRLRDTILADWNQVDTAIADLLRATQSGLELAAEEEEEEDEAGEMAAIAAIEPLLEDYRQLMDETFGISGPENAMAFIPRFLPRHHKLETRIREASRALFVDAIEEIHEAVDEVGESVRFAGHATAGLALLGVALASTIGILLSRPLIRRIGKLHTTTLQVQAGDLDTRVPDINSKDEIAELSHAFNAMVRNLKNSTASIDELNQQVAKRRAAESELQAAHDELEERVRERTYDLNQARMEAETANRTKSEFLANMSHELRTPLNHIIGFTELIAGEKLGPLNEMQQEYLTDVTTSSRHLLDLINDILDLSKVEAGKMELMLTNVNVGAMLRNCTVMFKEKSMKHQIELVLDDHKAPDQVLGDEIKLKQVFYNLLSNAFKYTPDKGQISISSWNLNDHEKTEMPPGVTLPGNAAEGALWAVRITDTGPGIPDGELERIFNPFEQVKGDERAHKEGTGLGLALTRRMVQLHGGTIWAENVGEGQGAIFTVILPEEAENFEAEE